MTQHFTHRGIRYGLALLIATSVAGAATPGFSQNVPVPKPAPKGPRWRRADERAGCPEGPRTTGATQAPPNPVIPDPHRNVPANIFATFDANQKAQAAKVSTYLSSLQTLVGNFVQVGPDGSKTKGDFYIQKPGKVRFEYDDAEPDRDRRRRIVAGGARHASLRPRTSIRCRRRRCASCCRTASTC